MKIAYIALRGVNTSEGITKVTREVASELSRRGHDVDVYCSNKYGDIDGVQNGFNVLTVNSLNQDFLEKMTLTFNAILKSLPKDYDVYHIHAMGPSIFAIIPKKKGKNVVIQSHGIEYDRPKWNSFAKFVLKSLERGSINNCTCLTVVSKKIQRHFKDVYNKETLFIPNFSDTPQNNDDVSMLEDYGLQPNKYFLFLNRIDAGKGLHYLIEAYNRLNTDIKLAICGPIDEKDEYHKSLINLASGNENIVFIGSVSGALKTTMYKYSYACCQTSESEGMSTSLLEIMSFAKCGIISDIEENVDVIEDAGILYKNTNVNSLVSALNKAIDKPSLIKELGQKAYCIWEKNYTLEKVTDQYERMYEEVTRQNKE